MLKRKYIHLLISSIITGILLFVVFKEQSLSQIFKTILGVDAFYLAIFVALSVLGALFRMLRYRLILRDMVGASAVPSVSKLLLVTFARNACVDLLPARLGEAVYVYMLNRLGVRLATGVSSFGLCFVIDVLVLGFIAILAIFWGALTQNTFGPLSIKPGFAFYVVALGILCAGFLLIYNFGKVLLVIASCIPFKEGKGTKVRSKVVEFCTVLRIFIKQIGSDFDGLKEKGKFHQLVILTIFLRVLKYAGLYVLLLAVLKQFSIAADQVPFWLSFLAFLAAEASASLPVSGIMGFGAYEGAWLAIFAISGIAEVSHITVAFVTHMITQILGYSLGIISILMFSLLMVDTKET